MRKTTTLRAVFPTKAEVREPQRATVLCRAQHFAWSRTVFSPEARKIKTLKGFVGARATVPIGFPLHAD